MIKTALVAMTVLGCDCDARVCEFVSETPARWTTVAECEAAVHDLVRARQDIAYPLLSAECHVLEPPGPAPESVATLVADTGHPRESVHQTAPTGRAAGVYAAALSGSTMVFRKATDGYVYASDSLGRLTGMSVSFVRQAASDLRPRW